MQRVTAMMAYVVSEGRLCALKPAEWSLLLTGVALQLARRLLSGLIYAGVGFVLGLVAMQIFLRVH